MTIAARRSTGGPDRRDDYLPAAVLGNGSLLVTLSARGELERLFWPHVDHGQHLGELRLGLAGDDGTRWLDETPFEWSQEYLDGVSALRTVARDEELEVEIVDLVRPREPILVRRVRCSARGCRLVVMCRPELEEARHYGAAYVDPDRGSLVFYHRAVALAVSLACAGSGSPPRGEVYSVDGGAGRAAGGTVAHRSPIEGMLVGELEGGALVVAAFASTPAEATARVEGAAGAGFEAVLAERREHDRASLARVPRPRDGGSAGLTEAVERSVLTLELLADREHGAAIAAPEFDPAFVRSGGYGFVWPRDLAYVVLGLLAAGRADLAAPALRWLARHQAPEGLWLQRYWTDGVLAPCWSMHQIDETGACVFAYEAAWQELGDEALDRELWPSARAAADFLSDFRDTDTGLPLPSVDLWEEREAQHSYSAAAVFGGLAAAAEMAARHEPELVPRYREAAEGVRAGIEGFLWSEEHGRYLRSRLVGRRDSEGEPVPPLFDRRLAYPNGVVRSVEPVDGRVDSSLLGLAWPFRAVDPRSPRLTATVAAIERELALADGGLLRYQGDHYAGGNPWLLTTLWLGLYYRQVGNDEGLRRCVDYALRRRTALGLLPEQATRDGRPAWVVPLGWSHAMLLLATLRELAILRS